MLFLDGVYIGGSNGHPMRFQRVKAPTINELTKLTHTIAHRVARYLVHQGLLEYDTGNIYLTPEAMDASDEDPSSQLLGSSITSATAPALLSTIAPALFYLHPSMGSYLLHPCSRTALQWGHSKGARYSPKGAYSRYVTNFA